MVGLFENLIDGYALLSPMITTAAFSLYTIHNTNLIPLPPGLDKLATKSVQRLALTLESVDDIHGGDGLAAGVLRVRDTVADYILEKDLEDTSGFFINQS